MNKIESRDSRIYVPMTSYKANVQHTLSIRSAYDEHPMKPRGNHEAHPTQIWKYVAMLVMVLVMGIGESWGDLTTHPVYCAISPTSLGDGTLKLNVHKGTTSDGGVWYQVDMTKITTTIHKAATGETKDLYYASIQYVEVGLQEMQFQIYDGSTQRETHVAFNSWTTSSDTWTKQIFDYENKNFTTYPAGLGEKSSYIYFDAADWTDAHIQLAVGNGLYQGYYELSHLDNTTLYYENPSLNWSDAVQITFLGNGSNFNTGWNWLTDLPNWAHDYAGFLHYSLTQDNYYLFRRSAGDGKGAVLSYAHLGDLSDSYESLNKTQTVQARVSTNGSAYADAAFASWPGAVSVARTYLSSASATSTPAAADMTSASIDAVLTSDITLTGSGNTEYNFVGWGDAPDATPDGNDEKTYTITDATTVYAFFRTREYGVTFNMKGHGSAIVGQTIYHGGTVSEPDEPSAQGYKFDGWYKEEGCTNEWNFANDVVTANTELFAKWTERYRVDFVVNGETTATIYRAAGEALSATPADNGVMPADPADNTLSSCGANKFVGWSTTDIGGDAVTTAPTGLFSYASANEITVLGDSTYYAVFGDSIPANATKGLSLARTVMWSEDWTGGLAINDGQPTEPTPSGGYKISNIRYAFKDGTGTSAGGTHVATGNDAGGQSPEVLIGKKGTGGTAGSLGVTEIPRRGAKRLTLSFRKKADPTLKVQLGGDGYYFLVANTNLKEVSFSSTDGGGEKMLTIICGNANVFSLEFAASGSANARIDDIVVKVLEDGATNYRTRCPSMTVTAHPATTGTPFFITSSASKTVRSQDSIHIVGSNLTKNGAVSISDVSIKFVLKSAKNGPITTRSNGTIDTIAYIYYTPDAEDTEDGLDTYDDFTISVAGNGGMDVPVSQTLIGRHLPENFVIAVYKNSKWWALPANHTNGTPAPIEIKVDNESTPTKVLTADVNVYTLYGQNAGDYTNGNGHYVRLAMHGQSNAPLFGGSDNKLGKSGNATIGGNLGKGYWWRFEQKNTSVSTTADVKYYMSTPNNPTRRVNLSTQSGDEKWGQYSINSGSADEIRLIPLYAEEIEVSGTEWSKDAIAVEANFGTKSVEKVKATVGASSSGKKSVPAEVDGAYFFDLDGTISFVGHAGERLILDWYNSSDVQVGASWLTIPSIKDAGAATTWSTIASTPTLEDIVVVRNPMAVDGTGAKAKRVVLDGGQVEISAGKELVVAETVRRLTGSGFGATEEEDIAIGSTAGAGLGALVMGSHDGTNKATVNFTTLSSGISGSTASVSQYLGTPFSDATVLSDWYNSWVYGIQYTEHVIGWARVNDGMDPFKGYAVISADGTNHVYWMQGTLVDSETKTIDGLNYQGGTATNPNNENLLANSWMAPIKINAFEEGDFTNADATIYIFNSGSPDDYKTNGGSTGTLAGQYSTYTPGSAGDAVIPAMQSFSVYTSGESASVTLDYNKLVYTPAVNGTTPVANRAPQRRTLGEETDKLHLYAYGESGYGDMVYLLAREDFANGFENGFDGRKVFGETVAPQMYAMTMDGNMAINCVPTMEGTVLGFRKGSGDSEYTFSFEYEGAETLYLNDLKAQTSTLIGAESSYTFTAAADDDEARFIISATPIGQMPTEVERQKSKVERQKIIIHGNLFIIRDGRMYHVMGTEVR